MEKYQISTFLWIKFCMNFPLPSDFINYICKKTGKIYLVDHLASKWNHYYKMTGCYGVMNAFYCDLDADLRDALVEYALKEWSPVHESTTFEKNKELLGL